jgi:DNA-binding NarL/FixJ family response regulator
MQTRAERPERAEGSVEAAERSRASLFIVSDVRLVREGLVWQLERDGRLDVRGAGAPSAATIASLAARPPDVTALDLSAAGTLDFAERLRARVPETKLIGFALSACDASIVDWARTGICGYVEREGSAADIVATVLHALNGELYCSPRFAANLLTQLAGRGRSAARDRGEVIASLTPREAQILQRIRLGASNKEIARQLGISSATVKNHVHNLLEKLDVRRRSQASAVLSGLTPNG